MTGHRPGRRRPSSCDEGTAPGSGCRPGAQHPELHDHLADALAAGGLEVAEVGEVERRSQTRRRRTARVEEPLLSTHDGADHDTGHVRCVDDGEQDAVDETGEEPVEQLTGSAGRRGAGGRPVGGGVWSVIAGSAERGTLTAGARRAGRADPFRPASLAQRPGSRPRAPAAPRRAPDRSGRGRRPGTEPSRPRQPVAASAASTARPASTRFRRVFPVDSRVIRPRATSREPKSRVRWGSCGFASTSSWNSLPARAGCRARSRRRRRGRATVRSQGSCPGP